MHAGDWTGSILALASGWSKSSHSLPCWDGSCFRRFLNLPAGLALSVMPVVLGAGTCGLASSFLSFLARHSAKPCSMPLVGGLCACCSVVAVCAAQVLASSFTICQTVTDSHASSARERLQAPPSLRHSQFYDYFTMEDKVQRGLDQSQHVDQIPPHWYVCLTCLGTATDILAGVRTVRTCLHILLLQ